MDQRTRNLRSMEIAMEIMDLPADATLGQMVDRADAIYDRIYRWFVGDQAAKDLAAIINVTEQVFRDVGVLEPAPLPDLPIEPGKQRQVATPTPKGVHWGTSWVSPKNTELPPDHRSRIMSGWALNGPQQDVINVFCGPNGHVHASLATIVKKARLSANHKGGFSKPRTAINSLIRRGLLFEEGKGVYTLTPRGRMFAEFKGWTPSVNPDDVKAVTE